MNAWGLALIAAVSVATSFLLSGMEAGLFALNRLRIRQLARAGDPRARLLNGFLAQPEGFLWTILVGNTVANFTVVTLGALGMRQLPSRYAWAWAVAFALCVFLFYMLCELMPKMLFRAFPNRLCLALARPFRLLHILLSPAVSAMTWLAHGLLWLTGGKAYTGRLFGNREELRQVMRASGADLSTEERSMIDRVFDLQKLTVRQTMRPLDRVSSVTTETPLADVFRICSERRLTRLPVWQAGGNRRRIVGLLSLEQLLYGDQPSAESTAGSWVQPAQYLGEDLRLEQALGLMQRSGQRLAIVLGRDRQEIGILSLEDILAVIFGKVNL